MATKNSPILIAVAGPNGAGKTTLVRQLDPELIQDVLFINPDELARELTNAFPTKTTNAINIQAGKEALRLTQRCLQEKRSFAFETTLTGHHPLATLREAKAQGFYLHLLYVGIESADDSINRIQERVLTGGHFIPPEDVKRRYIRSLENLPAALALADEVLLFDNSQQWHQPLLLLEAGKVQALYTTELPAWLGRVMDLQMLKQQHAIMFCQQEIPLSLESRRLLIDYIDKKIMLTESVQAKVLHLASVPEEAKYYAAKARQVENELKQLAKQLLEKMDLNLPRPSQSLPSYPKASLEAMKQRFENGQFKAEDIAYLQRDIKHQVNIKQRALSQSKGRTQ